MKDILNTLYPYQSIPNRTIMKSTCRAMSNLNFNIPSKSKCEYLKIAVQSNEKMARSAIHKQTLLIGVRCRSIVSKISELKYSLYDGCSQMATASAYKLLTHVTVIHPESVEIYLI